MKNNKQSKQAKRSKKSGSMSPVSFEVEPELKVKLEEIAATEKRSLSFLCREAVAQMIAQRRAAA